MKYKARHQFVEAVRFDQESPTIGRIRKLVGADKVRKETTFLNDEYYIIVNGSEMPLRIGDYVVLQGNNVKVYTMERFLEIYVLDEED